VRIAPERSDPTLNLRDNPPAAPALGAAAAARLR
jgi:hypothetical protein